MINLAVWSGPRNISTALMYSFGNRDDFEIIDEPFYANYLIETGLDHPMREEIILSQPESIKGVVDNLTKDRSIIGKNLENSGGYNWSVYHHKVASDPATDYLELNTSDVNAKDLCLMLLNEGLLCKETHKTVIRFAPPLMISKDDLDWAIDKITKVLRTI